MAKPMLVSLPLVLFLMDYWPLGRLVPDRPKPLDPPQAPAQPAVRDRKKSKKKNTAKTLSEPDRATGQKTVSLLLLEKIPLVVVAGIFCILAFYTQHKGGALSSLEAYPPGVRIANAVVSYALYLFKTVWPVNLAVFYPYVKEIPVWQVLASAALLLSASIAVVRYARRFPYLAFGWLWYLVTLMPVIGIIKVGDFSMADRYTYVTLIGPFVAVSWGVYDLAARWTRGKEAMAAAALMVVTALVAATFVQAGTWKNSATLFRHALAVTENNFMAHTNLAVALIDEERLDEALPHLETATKIRPDFPNARYNLGVIRLRQGRDDEAMGHFKAALRIDPGVARASHYAGLLHLQRGESAEAVQYLQKALAGGGPDPQVFAALADALAMSSRYEEALYCYERALTLNPDAVEVLYNTARILIAMGRVDEAIGHLRKAVRIKPDYARAHNNLGSALLMQKRLEEATYHFQEAVRIDPGYTMARENLKDALAQQKKGRR
jgi:tetratricopeptide (TPR) repeat protein